MSEQDRTQSANDVSTGGTAVQKAWSRLSRFDPRVAIAGRELARLRSEKTIVLALAIQLFVAAFSGFLVVGLVSMYDPGSTGQQVEIGVTGDATDEFHYASADHQAVEVYQYDSQEALAEDFETGNLDGMVVATTDGTTVDIEATIPQNSIRTTLVVSQLQEVLDTLESQQRDRLSSELSYEPLEPPATNGDNPYFTFSYTVLIPLLMFLPAFIAGSTAVDAVTEEVERGTLELLRVAPVTVLDIMDGKVAAAAILGPLQAMLWIVLLSLNGIPIANPLLLVVLVAGLTTALVVFGAALSLAIPDRQKAQLVYSLGLLGGFGFASLLPQHPGNTIARLAIGSSTSETVVFAFVPLLVAGVAYVAVRQAVQRTGVAVGS